MTETKETRLPAITTDEIAAIVRKAAPIMLGETDAATHKKEGHFNYVTDADVDVQRFLIAELTKALPEASFLAEEKDNAQLGDEPTFIIDPIDGTLNFMRGRKHSGISVGLAVNRRAELGVIYNPYTDEMFTARRGHGAFLNGAPLRVTENGFDSALIDFGTSPYNPELAQRTFDTARDFLLGAAELRRAGAATLDLCDIACGRADVFFEFKLSPWDYAAGSLIITEAGGRFALLDSAARQELPYGRPGCVLASNALCFDKSLEIIQRYA